MLNYEKHETHKKKNLTKELFHVFRAKNTLRRTHVGCLFAIALTAAEELRPDPAATPDAHLLKARVQQIQTMLGAFHPGRHNALRRLEAGDDVLTKRLPLIAGCRNSLPGICSSARGRRWALVRDILPRQHIIAMTLRRRVELAVCRKRRNPLQTAFVVGISQDRIVRHHTPPSVDKSSRRARLRGTAAPAIATGAAKKSETREKRHDRSHRELFHNAPFR